MTSRLALCKETLLATLDEQATINVREALATSMGRALSPNEIATARTAARRIAQEGTAVLMTAYPGQIEGVADRWKWGRHAVQYLTRDKKVISDLPYCVQVATGDWEAVIDEGRRSTQKKIDSDPLLSRMLGAPMRRTTLH
ncbi:hypothetical protein H3146_24705 [Streptomyces sp. OF3]|uniref:Uncharacterized protein n=1 Tax=Streptomyces alkaliterrae TaxID=2213162 RepID=A0A7W3ZQ91_9ACTN|nr:hypothetical protein [Streptomyces alkaliterrae]MBB1256528.1 hypothetical protein [Streptomyces alkaliterrae]